LNALPEHHRFLRGLCAWVGFRQCAYPYARRPRASGNSSYTFRSMGRLAIDAITGFSIAPLRLGVVMSGISAMFGVLAALYATYSYVALNAVPGWASTVMLLAFFSSMQLLTLGIIGEYVGRIFMVLKGRPHAIVASVVGLEVDPHAPKGRILFPPTAGD
jgi:dolichol-phosphate mannosyltransferase